LDGERECDTVEAHTDRRSVIRGVVDKTHAPQAKLRLTAAESRLYLQAGNGILQIVHIGNVLVRKTRARDHGHGDADVLRRFFTSLRGHHDFL